MSLRSHLIKQRCDGWLLGVVRWACGPPAYFRTIRLKRASAFGSYGSVANR